MKKHTLHRRQFLQLALLLAAARLPKMQRVQASTSENIIVIGAGAAGIAAANRLHMAGYTVTVLEARDRIGGRVFTNFDLAAHPIEFGAEFIHGDEVVTWQWMESFGLRALEENDDESVFIHYDGELLNIETDDLPPTLAFIDEAYDASLEWIDEGEPDANIESLIEAWADYMDIALDSESRQLINNILASDYGADIDQAGIFGLAELSYEGDGSDNFRIEEGYTFLLQQLAKGLDIRLSTPVQGIQWDATGAEIITTQSTFEADRVVITLPLGVLQAGDVTFDPPLPPEKLTAIQALGAGHVDKLILKFTEPFWSDEFAVLATPLASQVWWRPGWGRDNESPILTALIGGQAAENFEQLDEQAVIQAGLQDLEAIFGVSNLAEKLVEGHFISWGSDPYAKMGYSHVPVGAVGQRAVLARSVENILFFAGEATHTVRAATVHGALESGLMAAEQIMALGD
jgi:monoamine oxidase